MNFLNHHVTNLHTAALLLGAAGLLSRLLGVLRDRLLAAEFGAGRELDIYYAAFQIPDFMSALFLLGAASAAILPVFQEYLAKDRKQAPLETRTDCAVDTPGVLPLTGQARDFISVVSVAFFCGAVFFSLLAYVITPIILPFIAPGFSASEQAHTIVLTRIMLFSPVLLGLASIFSAVIQSFHRFFVYAAAAVLYNVGIIGGILFLVPVWGVAGLGGGVVAGALLSMAVQLWALADLGFRPQPLALMSYLSSMLASVGVGVRRVAMLSLPRVFSVALSQLTIMALIAIGSLLAEGSVAVFTLAQNLYFVPIGIFGTSYAVALFPRMARAAVLGDGRDFFHELFTGIRSILFWVAPSAALFLVLRAHLVRAALGAGAFSWEDTRLTAAVLAVLVVAMAAGALQTLLIRGFYALGNTWIPFVVSVAASAFTIGLSWELARGLGAPSALRDFTAALFRVGDLPHPEVLGLGIGFAIGLVANVVMLFVFLVRYAERSLGVTPARQNGEFTKIIFGALVAGGITYLVRVSFSETLPLITFARVVVQGAVAGAVGLAAYWGILTLLGSRDVVALRRSVTKRLFSIGVLPKSWDGA